MPCNGDLFPIHEEGRISRGGCEIQMVSHRIPREPSTASSKNHPVIAVPSAFVICISMRSAHRYTTPFAVATGI